MPKIQKKPTKKAELRTSVTSNAARREAKRSVVPSRSTALKPRPVSDLRLNPRPRAVPVKATRAKLTARSESGDSGVLRARRTILPPKPSRPGRPERVAPPPPRTPRAISEIETPTRTRSKARRDAVAEQERLTLPAPPNAARDRAKRPRVTEESWRSIEAAATRSANGSVSELQRAVIRAALEGRDSLVVIPEDALAVACYQLPAALLTEPTVVLSPTTSELQAQAETLTAQRKPFVCLLPETSGPDRSAALTRIAQSGSLLVLLSPEALTSADVQKALAKSGIALFAVEEAHCASSLSPEMRPSYADLGPVLRALGKPPVMAITRVATSAVLADISARLELTHPETVRAPAVRSNLRIATRLARGENRQAALVRLVERLASPGLVFCATPHDVDSVYSALLGAHVAAHRYHSAMTASERAAELLNFRLPGARGVMVAVSAFAPGSGLPGLAEQTGAVAAGFGRGLGKRDLRFVVHYQSPASIEQYLREIEHAGGDGQAATCVLFHESSHRSLHEVMLAQQRFKATHLAELGRALESPALEDRPVSIESLALSTGQSRRTTDRLAALLADAGVVSRNGGWVRVLGSASELIDACRRLGAELYALREQDGRRLAAVSAFAESAECKLAFLNRYLGDPLQVPCGQCSACSEDLASTESLPVHGTTRRPMVQEFSVRPAGTSAPEPNVAPAPVTMRKTEPAPVMPRAGR